MNDTNKFKLTSQRKIILDFVKNNYNHPSVDEIYLAVKDTLPRISKKTVYSNLKVLSENDLIKEIIIESVKRYEPIQKNHIHAICKNCGKIIDINAKAIIDEIEKLKKKSKDFKIESSTINLNGFCKECLRG